MTRPDDPFEAMSYDLNKFRERRVADRRFSPRATADRRQGNENQLRPASDSPVGQAPEQGNQQ
jgi:hypothetical protein